MTPTRAGITIGLLLTLLLHAASALAQTGDGPLTLAEYQARLRQEQALLSHGGSLAEARSLLAGVDAVQLPSGAIVPVTPLLAGVEDVDAAAARVDLALSQLAAAQTDRTADRLAQRDRVLERLALEQPTLWQRIRRWFVDLIDALRPRTNLATGEAAQTVSTLLVWGIVASGGLLIAITLSYWLRRLLGSFVADAETRRRREAGEAAPLTASAARHQATSLAQQGNYRQAVRRLYLAALLRLDELHLLRYDRSLTNREVLARTDEAQPVRRHLVPVVETFDRIWYGVREPDQETFEAYRREIDALMATSGETDPAGAPSGGDS